jgi:hypothetical protein
MANKKYALLILLMVACIGWSNQGAADSKSGKQKRGVQAALGCRLLPADNIWNTPIDALPVDTNSNTYIDTIGADRNIHADFGSGLWEGGPIGIPFTTVPGDQEKVSVSFYYDDESDAGPYPIPADAPIEGGEHSDGDRHVLVVDRDNCVLYELYDAWPQGDGSWEAGSGAIYDLNSNALRPNGWTSADAAGLPVLPGLVRYEEVAAGEIKHALRFTVPQTRKAYVWPARHYASSLTGSQYPPMGQRFRLKASFDISGYSQQVQVILRALKKYGMILADNGSAWFISGAPDERWNNDVLRELHNVRGADFEAVDQSSLMVSPNSGQVLQNVQTASITVVSPNGGENWTVGSTHNITWTSTGTVGNVKIRYSADDGSNWSTVAASTSNDGSYSWTVPDTASARCIVRVGDTAGSPVDSSDTVFTITRPVTGQPEITVDRNRLNFGAVSSGVHTGPQHFRITNGGTGTLNWNVSTNKPWLSVTPSSGTGAGKVTVSISPEGLTAGLQTGTITVADSSNVSSPQTVTVDLSVITAAADQPPFGTFDSPQEGTVVMSSIPVTGWVLDDIEVESVKIYRYPLAGEGSAVIYIGKALLVEGARPDVETANPDYPNNYRAGWGYMMLTNYLPNGGNGTVTLLATARDTGGKETILGTKNITGNNEAAVKPFGAIDTPSQGGEAFGASYINWGWVLTPMPNEIPSDGSTINVWVDGVNIGQPVYNNYRADIAALFPGYANSDGAVGYFYLDTTEYEDGVHTIQWTATDNDGNTDGIGSRFFSIENAGRKNKNMQVKVRAIEKNRILDGRCRLDIRPIWIKKGYNEKKQFIPVFPDPDGVIVIEINQMERMEIRFNETGLRSGTKDSDEMFNTGFKPGDAVQIVNGNIRDLPAGAMLDTKKGIFYWQTGAGYVGQYHLIFVDRNSNLKLDLKKLLIKIQIK